MPSASDLCKGQHLARPIPIWLDCDTGHDDAFAILLSAQCPALNLLGISTVFGNAPLEHTTYNTRAVLKAINREDVPVYAGAARPFCRAPSKYYPEAAHGPTGLRGITNLPVPTVPEASSLTTRPLSTVDIMYQTLIRQPPGTVWLIAIGAMTNIALLFATHPDLAAHIAGLSMMGGVIGNDFTSAPLKSAISTGADPSDPKAFGNVTPTAEFNIFSDPEAAQSLFVNRVLHDKTTLVTLDLTHQMLATKAARAGIARGFGRDDTIPARPASSVRGLFVEILAVFAGAYAEQCGFTEGAPLHDPLAVIAVLAPSLLDDRGGERFAVRVVTDGQSSKLYTQTTSEAGRTNASKLEPSSLGVRIPRGLDTQTIWEMLDLCLERVESQET